MWIVCRRNRTSTLFILVLPLQIPDQINIFSNSVFTLPQAVGKTGDLIVFIEIDDDQVSCWTLSLSLSLSYFTFCISDTST
ncbi:hypothetical protein VNO78_02375 [Psophocarpus tetragonolobus]|uniref:Uncharacterized protein n=1 Tax=Psophocarpus tetragonolobus TaxID=3891 RepID=A0AAN9XV42_PSOTE